MSAAPLLPAAAPVPPAAESYARLDAIAANRAAAEHALLEATLAILRTIDLDAAAGLADLAESDTDGARLNLRAIRERIAALRADPAPAIGPSNVVTFTRTGGRHAR